LVLASAAVEAPVPPSATAKAANTAVTIQADVETEVQVLLNKHFEYSRFIEDIVEVQALSSLRRFYTEDAGYALARQVDTDLIQLGRSSNNGAGTAAYANAYIGGDGSTAYNSASPNASALTDSGIRRMIQRLDDNDVPMDGRFLIVPPSTRNTLMGIARFTEQAFVGETGASNTIRNGEIGNVYGIPVFVSNNADTTSGSTATRVCLMAHKDFGVLVEQMGVRTQTQYKQEYLATLLTADTLYGVKALRDSATANEPNSSAAFALVVPS